MSVINWIKKVLADHKANVEYCRSLDNNPMVKDMMSNLMYQ